MRGKSIGLNSEVYWTVGAGEACSERMDDRQESSSSVNIAPPFMNSFVSCFSQNMEHIHHILWQESLSLQSVDPDDSFILSRLRYSIKFEYH